MKYFMSIAAVCCLLLVLSGCCLQHSWTEADCEHPKTCEKCGKTEGEALGHVWEEATCEKTRTCTRCGAEDGEPLEHTPGEWEEVSRDIVEAQVSYVRKCSQCGKVVDTKKETMDTLYKDGEFLLTVTDFHNRFSEYFFYGPYHGKLGLSPKNLPDRFQYRVVHETDIIGHIDFYNQSLMSIQEEGADVEKIAVVAMDFINRNSREKEEMLGTVSAILQTVDPQMTEEDAGEYSDYLVTQAISNGDSVQEKNGISYMIGYRDNVFVMLAFCG